MNKYKNSKGQYAKGPRIEKKCEQCDKTFFVMECLDRARFCSKKCWYEFMHGTKNPSWRGLFIEKVCLWCKKEFIVKNYHNNRKYCTHKCFTESIAKENHHNWQGGVSYSPYSLDFTDKLKEKIRGRDNFSCQICNMTEEENIIVNGAVLTIHHINYDKMDSSENNLIALCCACHTRTGYNRSVWIKYFKEKKENFYELEQ